MTFKGFPFYLLVLALLLVTGCAPRGNDKNNGAGKDWPVYMGSNTSSHYSKLATINKGNVSRLKVAWEYHTGDDVSRDRSQIQCNPLIIDGTLYGTSPKLKVFALHAATGEKIWEFDPDPASKYAKNVNRGVVYWKDSSDERVLFTSGPDLFALNAKTGALIETFGDSGKVSLNEGLGERAKDLYVVATSPGAVFKDLLIIGSRVSETSGAAPGYIRAFNIRTGKPEWVFHTIPKPGEYGYNTWPENSYKNAGGANSWAGMSLDEKRGVVYVPTGSATYDFWGGERKGEDLFANCLLAIDARTGKRIWHYQTVHHDLWDRDLPAPPNLLTVVHDGKKVDAIAQITKSGFVFVLDRDTGEPLFPVEERPVPESDLKGEEAWPTQPVPLSPPPFAPQVLTGENITNVSKKSHDLITDSLYKLRTGKLFIPPSTQGTIIFPGFDGGGEWGGAAVDPGTGIMYVNNSNMAWVLTMVETPKGQGKSAGEGELVYRVNCAVCHGAERQGNPSGTFPALTSIAKKYSREGILGIINSGRGFMPSFKHLKKEDKEALISYLTGQKENLDPHMKGMADNMGAVPYTHTGYNRFLDQDGYPAVEPPWGTISAIDLNKGNILWQVPLGEYEKLTKKGIPKTGTENYGGPVVTAGGLLFIGASKDGYFRAFDKDTGEELWKYKLPAGGYATPSVYEVDGKEYIVIACGGGKMGTPSGDSYVAFTLRCEK